MYNTYVQCIHVFVITGVCNNITNISVSIHGPVCMQQLLSETVCIVLHKWRPITHYKHVQYSINIAKYIPTTGNVLPPHVAPPLCSLEFPSILIPLSPLSPDGFILNILEVTQYQYTQRRHLHLKFKRLPMIWSNHLEHDHMVCVIALQRI